MLTRAAGSEVMVLELPMAGEQDKALQLPKKLTELRSDWPMKKTG